MADRRGWQPTDVLREAWLADTILLLSQHLRNSVLTGGSGVRNITKAHRLTYDVDFDTGETSLDTICSWMKTANKSIGGSGSLRAYDVPGLITIPQGRNLQHSFEGDRRMAPFTRCTAKKQYLRIHIMCVPSMPEMFTEYESLDLETVVPVQGKVPTANRKHLFFRKAARATRESRPEDFMDLTFILRTAADHLREIVDYCAAPARRQIVMTGLGILIADKTKFTRQVSDRLIYEALTRPVDDWVEDAAEDLNAFRTIVGRSS